MKNRYLIYFILAGIFLGMFTGVITHNVKASVPMTRYISFEDGVLSDESYYSIYNSINFTAEKNAPYGEAYIQAVGHLSTLGWKTKYNTGEGNGQFSFNVSYPANQYIQCFYTWFWIDPGNTGVQFELFSTDGSNLLTTIYCQASGSRYKLFYYDTAVVEHVIDYVESNVWCYVGYYYINSSSVCYFTNGSISIGEPRHIVENPRVTRIYQGSFSSGNEDIVNFDDVGFRIDYSYQLPSIYQDDDFFGGGGTGGTGGTGGGLGDLSEANQMFIGVFISLAIGIGLLVITRQPIVFVAGTSITAFLLSSPSMGTFQLMPTEFGVGIIVVLVLIGVIVYLTT